MKSNKFRRPASVSLYYAVNFFDRLKPKRSDFRDKLNQTYKTYRINRVSKRMIAKFYSMKLRNNSRWIFFKKHAKFLNYIYYNHQSLNEYKRTWVIDFKDFFVFRYNGEVFRKDGNKGFLDKLGRRVVKDFQGISRVVYVIIYAAGKNPPTPLSYKIMKQRDIIFKDSDKNNLKVDNLSTRVKASFIPSRVEMTEI